MIIVTIKNKQLSEKELSKFFTLIKHPLRRGILKLLSESPQSYTMILKSLEIPESSILNYHLREMENLLIKKNSSGKYELNEIGNICLQLVLKVEEKEDIPGFNKLQLVVAQLKRAVNFITITFSALLIVLVLELFLLNIIYLSSIIEIFASGAIFSIILSTSIFIIFQKSETIGINKLEKWEKLGTYSTLFTIWILIQTILTLW